MPVTAAVLYVFMSIVVASTLARGPTSTQSDAALCSIQVYVCAEEVLALSPPYAPQLRRIGSPNATRSILKRKRYNHFVTLQRLKFTHIKSAKVLRMKYENQRRNRNQNSN